MLRTNQPTSYHHFLTLTTALATGLITGTAMQMTATPALAAEDKASAVFEEILVTASKRGVASAQNLALSITAFNEGTLERLNATDFDEFIVQVPGTNFLDNGGPGRGNELASIRGLSPVADNTQSVVAQYLDGAPRFGRNYRLFDIGEVSVLRGPQGTLWGAQSIGGLISFRSNRPDLTALGASAQADTYLSKGDGGLSYRLGGHVNVPVVTDKFALRVAGHYIDESGYVDNIAAGVKNANDVEEAAWRLSALFRPSDVVEVTLIYHGNDLKADAPTYFSLAYDGFISDNPFAERPADQEFDLVNLIVDVDLGWGALNYTGSYFKLDNVYQDAERNVFGIPGFLGFTTNTLEQESWTHEIRLSSKSGGRFNWLVGVYYDDLEENDFSFQEEVVDPNVPGATPIFAEGFPIFALGGPEDTREIAVFGELSYAITDQLEILLGGRYFDWKVDNRQEFTYFGTNYQQETGEVGGDDTFFKAQLNYHPTDDMLLFVTRSEGFRFGGFNPFVGPALNIPESFVKFDPDKLVSYEAGMKLRTMGGRMLFNTSAYYMDWQNIQTVVFNESGTFAFTTNAPDLEAWGLEAEIVTQNLLFPGLYLAASYAYTKNRFTDDATVFEGVPFLVAKGDRLRRTPRHTWSADVGYEFAVHGAMNAFLRANYWHKAHTTTEGFNSNDGIIPIPAQDVVNISGGIIMNGWQAKAYINNLFNSRPLLQVFPNEADPTMAAEASSIRPRTLGLELTYRFGS
ncbi:MAG: hypothetical protein DCC73_09900 [Proteobacteria bacterium]|nr:MAG: hypothetical protein DCC73_09900 [Pseudomonadota bacterium]